MLKVDETQLAKMEADYPGILEQIRGFEGANVPPCSRCGSSNTADVQCGIIGRTICIALATTKVFLVANRTTAAKYYCRECKEFFG